VADAVASLTCASLRYEFTQRDVPRMAPPQDYRRLTGRGRMALSRWACQTTVQQTLRKNWP